MAVSTFVGNGASCGTVFLFKKKKTKDLTPMMLRAGVGVHLVLTCWQVSHISPPSGVCARSLQLMQTLKADRLNLFQMKLVISVAFNQVLAF